MPQLQGSRTEKNLISAFASEAQARDKYSIFALKAREEGLLQIAEIFEKTADNELAHARIWFELLHGQTACTAENLRTAQNDESYEYNDLYAEFAKVAYEEGFDDIAKKFEMVALIEKSHEERFKKLAENAEGGLVFSREGDTVWVCRNCGHIVIGKAAPETCPVCSHAQSFFEIKAENY